MITSGQISEPIRVESEPVLIDLLLVECMERVKAAWEESHPDTRESSLGHSAAGMWFFYWVSSDMLTMAELVRRGRGKDLRDACTDYIAAGFGEWRGPTLALESV